MDDKGIHTFRKGINLKENITVRLEFEHIYLDVAVQYISHFLIVTHIHLVVLYTS